MTPEDVAGLVADEIRLRVLSALVLEPGPTAQIARRSGVADRAALAALTKLESFGLTRRDAAGHWSFDAAPFREATLARRSKPDEPPGSPAEAVWRSFVVDGRLVQIPAARGKRLVVLDRLAGEFEPGHRYDEREVNDRLRRRHDDVAALRRYLVDEGFLSRDHGVYWRTGGSVDTQAT